MDEAFAADLEAIHWFSAVGKPLPALSMPTVAVASKDEALEHCSNPAWEDVTLEARNRLTEFLFMRDRAPDTEWNDITKAAKSRAVTPLVSRLWQPFAAKHGLITVGEENTSATGRASP